MQTVISSIFQTTIPKKIREQLALSVRDTLEWRVEGGRIIVTAPQPDFLQYKNSISIGKGSIQDDIEQARKIRADKYT